MPILGVTAVAQKIATCIGDLVHRIRQSPASTGISIDSGNRCPRPITQQGRSDRLHLLLLAKITRTWRQVLMIVQPATLLRWHGKGFRLFWKWKGQRRGRPQRTPAAMIALIRRMAAENPLWGAERIRGELLKVGIHVAKRSIQNYLRQLRPKLARRASAPR